MLNELLLLWLKNLEQKRPVRHFLKYFLKVLQPLRTKTLQKYGVLAHYKAWFGQLRVMMLRARMLRPR